MDITGIDHNLIKPYPDLFIPEINHYMKKPYPDLFITGSISNPKPDLFILDQFITGWAYNTEKPSSDIAITTKVGSGYNFSCFKQYGMPSNHIILACIMTWIDIWKGGIFPTNDGCFIWVPTLFIHVFFQCSFLGLFQVMKHQFRNLTWSIFIQNWIAWGSCSINGVT